MARKKPTPPDRIWVRDGCTQVMPLSELEIETIGVGDAIEYLRADKVAEAIKAESQWQSIETVPKDGTHVLFYTPEDTEIGWLAFVAESFYDKRGNLNDIHVPQWQDGLEPTHWMKLPDPPQ